jgi:hypothetical protein
MLRVLKFLGTPLLHICGFHCYIANFFLNNIEIDGGKGYFYVRLSRCIVVEVRFSRPPIKIIVIIIEGWVAIEG